MWTFMFRIFKDILIFNFKIIIYEKNLLLNGLLSKM